MTVRVNKDSFNLREKLSELERPIGLKGSDLMSADTAQEARDLVSAGRKNILINGACTINQRFGSGTYTLTSSTAYFPVDRFKSWAAGGGQFTIQRSDNAPPGFKNSLMFTVSTADSSIASGDYYVVQQRVEGYNFAHLNWGTANAKPVTLSFWVKADVTGKYGISFWPNGQNYNYVTHYNINTTDTWEYKTITIPGATSGTWLTDSGMGFGIWWDLGSGSTYETSTTETWGQSNKFLPTSTTKMISTNGAKFRMTGVQLEVGKNATDFEHRSYGEELALCERYFEKIWQNNNSQSPNSGGDGYNTIASGAHNGTYGYYVWKFRTQKRVRPSLDYVGKFRVLGGGSISNLTINEFYSPGVDAGRIRSSHSGSTGQAFVFEFDGGNSSNGYLSATAEL